MRAHAQVLLVSDITSPNVDQSLFVRGAGFGGCRRGFADGVTALMILLLLLWAVAQQPLSSPSHSAGAR